MKLLSKLDKHPNGPGYSAVKNVVATAENALASYGFGYLQNAYPGKAKIAGVPADLAVGVAAKAVSVLATLSGHGGVLRPHLDVLGNAGIGAYFHTLGSGHGFKKSGRVRAILPATAAAKLQAAVPESTIFGVQSRAPHGDVLTADDLAALASRR